MYLHENKLAASIAALCLSVTLPACGDSDSDDNGGGNTPATRSYAVEVQVDGIQGNYQLCLDTDGDNSCVGETVTGTTRLEWSDIDPSAGMNVVAHDDSGTVVLAHKLGTCSGDTVCNYNKLYLNPVSSIEDAIGTGFADLVGAPAGWNPSETDPADPAAGEVYGVLLQAFAEMVPGNLDGTAAEALKPLIQNAYSNVQSALDGGMDAQSIADKVKENFRADGTANPFGNITGSEPNPNPDPNPEPSPDPDPTPDPEPSPDPDPTPDPEPSPDPDPNPDPEPSPDPEPEPEPEPLPDLEPESTPEEWMAATTDGSGSSADVPETVAARSFTVPRNTIFVKIDNTLFKSEVPEFKECAGSESDLPGCYVNINCPAKGVSADIPLDQNNLLGTFGEQGYWGFIDEYINGRVFKITPEMVSEKSGTALDNFAHCFVEMHLKSDGSAIQTVAEHTDKLHTFTTNERGLSLDSCAAFYAYGGDSSKPVITFGTPEECGIFQNEVYIDNTYYNININPIPDPTTPEIVIVEQMEDEPNAYVSFPLLIKGWGVDNTVMGKYWYGDDQANAKNFINGQYIVVGKGLEVPAGGEKSQVLHLQYTPGGEDPVTADYLIKKTKKISSEDDWEAATKLREGVSRQENIGKDDNAISVPTGTVLVKLSDEFYGQDYYGDCVGTDSDWPGCYIQADCKVYGNADVVASVEIPLDDSTFVGTFDKSPLYPSYPSGRVFKISSDALFASTNYTLENLDQCDLTLRFRDDDPKWGGLVTKVATEKFYQADMEKNYCAAFSTFGGRHVHNFGALSDDFYRYWHYMDGGEAVLQWAYPEGCGFSLTGKYVSSDIYLMTYNESDPSADKIITPHEDDSIPDIVIEEKEGVPESAYVDVVLMMKGPVNTQTVGTYSYGDIPLSFGQRFTIGSVLRIGEGLQVDNGGVKMQHLKLEFETAQGNTYSRTYLIKKTYTAKQ